MLTIYVPTWAASHTLFDISVELGPPLTNGRGRQHGPDLQVQGWDLIYASVLSGRPWNMLKDPLSLSTRQMAQWRVYSCLGLLQPSKAIPGAAGTPLERPVMYQDEVDASEKANLSFALGGAMTYAWLQKKLDIRWLAHFSLARHRHSVVKQVGAGKVEPDYIGVKPNRDYIVAEAKGVRQLRPTIKNDLDSKRQTRVVHSVNGQQSVPQYGFATESGGKYPVRMYVTDPSIELDLPPIEDWIKTYYEHLGELLGSDIGNQEDVNDGRDATQRETLDDEQSELRDETFVDWVPVQLFLPEEVSKWASGEQDLSWEVLSQQVREQYPEEIIMNDLSVVVVSASR